MLREVIKSKGPITWDYTGLAKEIVNRAKSYSVPSRSITVTNNKLDKKVEKLKLAGRSNTSIFAQILLHTRRKLKHRGLSMVKVGDKDWLDLKAVCGLATDFCNEFGISIKEGYKEYIDIGISKMQNFSLFKFKGLHGAICNYYDAHQEILMDKTPQATKECHDIYLALISEKVGFTMGFENNPEKYKYFIRVKNGANNLKITYKTYIKAQFAGFDWQDGVPDPIQLIGDKAIHRLQKYAYKESITIGKSNTLNATDFKKIKKKRHG